MQRHGGELTYDRGGDGGACFHLTLPIWKAQGEPELAPRTLPKPQEAGRVLAVDDEQVVLFGLQRLVKAWGWELTPAGSAAQALEALEGASFDVALVDLRMPGISGLELIERLAELAPEISVVAMSGYLSEENRLALEALGVHRVLPKPVPSERLRETLSTALRERRAPHDGEGGGERGRESGKAGDEEAEADTRDESQDGPRRSWLHADTPAEGWSRYLGESDEE
jgi:CheY-like chemotaxis protein